MRWTASRTRCSSSAPAATTRSTSRLYSLSGPTATSRSASATSPSPGASCCSSVSWTRPMGWICVATCFLGGRSRNMRIRASPLPECASPGRPPTRSVSTASPSSSSRRSCLTSTLHTTSCPRSSPCTTATGRTVTIARSTTASASATSWATGTGRRCIPAATTNSVRSAGPSR